VKQDVEKVTKSIAIAHNPKLGGRNNRRGSVASKADIEKIVAPSKVMRDAGPSIHTLFDFEAGTTSYAVRSLLPLGSGH
jgi:hypothetical protein